jgi:hypothetical protein
VRPLATAATVSASALLLTGCGLATTVQDAVGGRNCTTIGLAEGVSVDLTGVLPFEGGDYRVTLTSPAFEDGPVTDTVSSTTEGPMVIGRSLDLDDHPVQVGVQAEDPTGAVVFRAATTATPVLDQPNGPRCDPKNYAVNLQATAAGELVPLPLDEPVRDDQGRVSLWLDTRCGVLWLYDPYSEGGAWVRVDGRLDDGAGGPPPGWNTPIQRGWVAQGADRWVFEDELGHREVFRPEADGDEWTPCQAS